MNVHIVDVDVTDIDMNVTIVDMDVTDIDVDVTDVDVDVTDIDVDVTIIDVDVTIIDVKRNSVDVKIHIGAAKHALPVELLPRLLASPLPSPKIQSTSQRNRSAVETSCPFCERLEAKAVLAANAYAVA